LRIKEVAEGVYVSEVYRISAFKQFCF